MHEETIEIVEERCVTFSVYQLSVLSHFYKAGAYLKQAVLVTSNGTIYIVPTWNYIYSSKLELYGSI